MTGLSPSFGQTLIATPLPPTLFPTEEPTIIVTPSVINTIAPSDEPTPTVTNTQEATVQPTPTPTATNTTEPTLAPTVTPKGLISMLAPYGSLSPVFSFNTYVYSYTSDIMNQYLNQRFQVKVDNSISQLQYATCYQQECSAENYDVYNTICRNDCQTNLYYTFLVNTDARYISILVNEGTNTVRQYTININTDQPTSTPTLDASSQPSYQPTPAVMITPPSLSALNIRYGTLSPSFTSNRYSYIVTAFGNEYFTSTTSPPPTNQATTDPTSIPTNTNEPTVYIKPTLVAPQPWLSSLYTSYGYIWPQFSPAIRVYDFTPNQVYENIVLTFASSVNTGTLQVAECIRTPTSTPTLLTTDQPTPTATATATATATSSVSPTSEYTCLPSNLVYKDLCKGTACVPNTAYTFSFNPKNVTYLSVRILTGLLGAPQNAPYQIYIRDVKPATPTPSVIPTPTASIDPTVPTASTVPTTSIAPTTSAASGEWVYLGCYSDSSSSRIMSQLLNEDAVQTNQLCQKRAMKFGFSYAATQYGKGCWAGKTFVPNTLNTNCNMKCAGDSTQNCGGFYASSVYQWLPTGATLNPTEYPSAVTPSTATATSSVSPSPTSTELPTLFPTEEPTPTPTATATATETASPSAPTQIVEDPTFTLPSAISATLASTQAPTITVAPTTASPTGVTPTPPFQLYLTPSSATHTLRIRQCSDDSCTMSTSKWHELCTLCDSSIYTYNIPLYQDSTFIEMKLFSSDIGLTSEQNYAGVITTYIMVVNIRASQTYQQGYWKYIGCFQSTPSSPILSTLLYDDFSQSNIKCQSYANYNGYRFAGTSLWSTNPADTQNCYASHSFDPTAYTISNSCNVRCSADKNKPTSTFAPTPTTLIPSATVIVTPTQASSDGVTPTTIVELPTFQPTDTPTSTPTQWPIQETCGSFGSMSVYEFINAASTTQPPSPTPTSTTTATTVPTVAATPSPTATSTVTVTPTATSTASPSPTATATATSSVSPSPTVVATPTATSTLTPTILPTLSQSTALPSDPNAAALFQLTFSSPTITQEQLSQIQQLLATAGEIPISDINRIVVTSPQLSLNSKGKLKSLLHARLLAVSTINVKILPSANAPSIITFLLNLLSQWATPTSTIRTSPLFSQLGFDASTDNINLTYQCADGVDATPCGAYTGSNTMPTAAGSNLLAQDDTTTTTTTSSSSSSMSSGAIVGTVFGVLIGFVMFGVLVAYCMKSQQERKSDSRSSFSV